MGVAGAWKATPLNAVNGLKSTVYRLQTAQTATAEAQAQAQAQAEADWQRWRWRRLSDDGS